MEIGTGKYDQLCRHACGEAGAMAAILIIFDGDQGSGFSVQGAMGNDAGYAENLA